MRASEFIIEGKNSGPKGAKKPNNARGGNGKGKPHKEHENTMQGVSKSRDVGGYDRVYHMNRLMMAMAMADGKSNKPVEMDEASWVEKYNTHHPYTQEEANMVAAAVNTVPTDYKQTSKWSRSVEPDEVHKVSPVTGFRGFQK